MNKKSINFIQKAQEIHKNEDGTPKYDYSKVEYKNNYTKVCIICPKHGEFYIRPKEHLKGNGCRKCYIERHKKTTEQFIIDAIKVHKNKYDYSKVEYKGAMEKVLIICKKCGNKFWQNPNVHLMGSGCPKCSHPSKPYSQTEIENMLSAANKDKNGNKLYEILPFDYKRKRQKIDFICPIHGKFTMSISSFLKGCKCPKCAHRSYAYSKEEFIEKAKAKHGDKYDYSKVEYKNNHTKICIICPIHGEFWQTPSAHLNTCGCYKCGKMNCSKTKTKTTEQFIEDSKKIFGDRYDYSKVEYKGNKIKVCLICKKHGEFLVRPDAHLSRHQGCPQCASESNISETLLFEHLSKKFPNANFFHSKRSLKNFGFLELDIYSDKYKIAIEYQGNQHFIANDFFGGEKGTSEQIKRDMKKIKLCEENEIKLFHFSYEKNMLNYSNNYKLYTDENELFEDIKKYIEELE